ncbi:two-component system response regulator [Pseudodesulfovibrio nedwellii]|uniref:Two-component system response regulator n=1 Tax=Pseudodesulfovibrio nedwellii TaxID=2973072 RepID=A0ABN6S8Y1_9BACT|nr:MULTISPECIES: HD domain-containing phosphohydrolase [Pseudodesulfovibrio]BDQ38658.1 two-component system response regulator [Pseudodesulfovibrio nedwellii]
MIDKTTLYSSSILIVDDNPTNIALLEDILEEEGYDNYTSTTDPRMVVELHAKEKFDLLLLDIRMPYMNGIEVMLALRDQNQSDYLPILVLTAQTDQQTRQRALEAGAKDFLTKPFDHWEVLLRIRNMLVTRHYYKRQVVRGDLLEEQVRERTRALSEAQLEIVRRLGRAGEYRDNETGAHVIRMSKVAEILARGLGLENEMCERILHASPMHDVGKIAIPDAILLKPGPLDKAEWEIMKGHTTFGSDIMGDHPSDVILMASELALCHHEWWNGNGYPNGLKGENIPLCARIATVSDVFDALMSHRPYKEPWPVEKAVAYIKESSGTQFDPTVVEVFLDSLPAIMAVRKEHPDPEKG